MYRCRLWCCIFTKFCRWTSGRLTIGLLFVLSLLALLTALQNDVTYIWLWRFVCEHSSGRIARAIPAHLQAFCVYTAHKPYNQFGEPAATPKSSAPIRQTPTTDWMYHASAVLSDVAPLHQPVLDSLEFTAGQSSQFDCRTGPVSTRTKNSPVCLSA